MSSGSGVTDNEKEKKLCTSLPSLFLPLAHRRKTHRMARSPLGTTTLFRGRREREKVDLRSKRITGAGRANGEEGVCGSHPRVRVDSLLSLRRQRPRTRVPEERSAGTRVDRTCVHPPLESRGRERYRVAGDIGGRRGSLDSSLRSSAKRSICVLRSLISSSARVDSVSAITGSHV